MCSFGWGQSIDNNTIYCQTVNLLQEIIKMGFGHLCLEFCNTDRKHSFNNGLFVLQPVSLTEPPKSDVALKPTIHNVTEEEEQVKDIDILLESLNLTIARYEKHMQVEYICMYPSYNYKPLSSII